MATGSLLLATLCFLSPETIHSLVLPPIEYYRGPHTPAPRVDAAVQALRLDPASPYRWCDLAEALQAARQGDPAACMRRAVELGGALPPILMRAVNLHLARGEHSLAMGYAARIMELTPEYDAILLASCRRFRVPQHLCPLPPRRLPNP